MTETRQATLAEFLEARFDAEEEAWRGGLGLATRPDFSRLAAHVLADLAAKRRIVELHSPDYPELSDPECWTCHGQWPCPTLLALAQPYADAPGWREEWRQ